MDNITRRDSELPYISDEAVMEEQKAARKLLREFNTTDPSDFQTLSELLSKIVNGSHKNIMVVPPFYCDYGSHIEVGENFFANYNCTILDVAPVLLMNTGFPLPLEIMYGLGEM